MKKYYALGIISTLKIFKSTHFIDEVNFALLQFSSFWYVRNSITNNSTINK